MKAAQMSRVEEPPSAILIMKVGYHVDETFEAIVGRKRREELASGLIFWGYGGTLCHPVKVVRPFAKALAATGESVVVIMTLTASQFRAPRKLAREYSLDGAKWHPLPSGIAVTGSRYALVCKNLQKHDYYIDLSRYWIPLGPKAGSALVDYLRGRVDKAIGLRGQVEGARQVPRTCVRYRADLVEPYAVLLR